MTDSALIGPVAAPDLQVMAYNIRRRMPAIMTGDFGTDAETDPYEELAGVRPRHEGG